MVSEKKEAEINAMRALWAAAACLAVLQCTEAFAETTVASMQWQSITGGSDGRRRTEQVSSLMSELLALRGGCGVLSVAFPCRACAFFLLDLMQLACLQKCSVTALYEE